MYEDSYLVISIPDDIGIYNEREIEKTCNYNLVGFTASRINCKVNGSVITIRSGFTYEVTTEMTDNDSMVPPTLEFSLPQFWNPRTMDNTGAFGLSIYSVSNEEIYSWNTTYALTVNGATSTAITAGPAVKMSRAATPQAISLSQASKQNGAITDYNFTVQTTNYLIEGDTIVIELPDPVYFSEDSKCLGLSSNLRINQTYEVGTDLDSMTITLLLPLSYRRLQAGSTAVIPAGQAFTFQLTSIKNPTSTTPTTSSITYASYTDGNLIET